MAAKFTHNDEIETERSAIARMSKLSAVHWIAVILSLMLTLGASYFASVQVSTEAANRFERYANHVVELVQERLAKYEDALASGVAAVHAAGGNMTHEQWHAFTAELQIETKYPGINGMGIIYKVPRERADEHIAGQQRNQPGFQIYPEHSGDTLYPITYIEPAGENSAALGLDMAHEANRYSALLQSRDNGQPQITGPIVLVQDAQKTPGFLFFTPFYAGNRSDSVAERRENFVGMVYAPFIFNRLIKGLRGRDNELVRFSIRDNKTILYDERNMDNDAFEPEFKSTHEINVHGRKWTFDIWATPEFQVSSRSNEAIMILLGGLIIDALLLSLFILLTRSNRRALRFADQMTFEARHRADSLQRSNEDLERFAFVASHDLKTPLRGIGYLSECIRDDLDNMREDCKDNELFDNLEMLEDQVKRMDNLITGILKYSSINSDSVSPELVDTALLVSSICASVGLRPDQYKLTGDLIEFKTDVIRFEQVLLNLIGNAHKYHTDPYSLQLDVNIEDKGEKLVVTVADNGPGIDPRYHDRIFEMFQTLQPSKSVDSTGIGLAIVKKTITHYGGKIRLDSQPGNGSRFTFDWPKRLDADSEMRVAA